MKTFRLECLFVTIALLIFVHCERNSLFDPSKAVTVSMYAFLSDSLKFEFKLSDTTRYLKKSTTVLSGNPLAFVGFVMPLEPEIRYQWQFDDTNDVIHELKCVHTFKKPGLHVGVFVLLDNSGNKRLDTCIVYVNEQTSIIGISPIDRLKNVQPFSAKGITFSWTVPATAGATTADFYLSTSPVFTQPEVLNIPGTQLIYKDSLLDSTIYYWRIVAKNSNGIVDSSQIYQFATGQVNEIHSLNVTAMNDTTIQLRDTIVFHAKAIGLWPDTLEYRWDFTRDGKWDDSTFTSDTVIHVKTTYLQPGTFHSLLYVKDRKTGRGATDTVTVKVNAFALTITNIRNDTVVLVGDTVPFFANVVSSGTVNQYTWDFDGNGIVDFTSSSTASTLCRYSKTGIYNAIFTSRDNLGNTIRDTIKITVLNFSPLNLQFISRDTIIPFNGIVACSVAVTGGTGTITIEVDTANTGNYKVISTGRSVDYRFTTTSSIWDSVKVRITDTYGTKIKTGFAVSIRPRSIDLLSIDSTESTITVRYTSTKETDFAEYVIYRDTLKSVDSADELWARIFANGVVAYSSSANFSWNPRYYQVYQRDKEGLISAGSNVVFGNIKNTKISIPVFVKPLQSDSTLWADDTIRWKKCGDANGNVRYGVTFVGSMTQNLTGLTDTQVVVKGFEKTGFTGSIRITAYGVPSTDTSFTLHNNIRIKPRPSFGQRLIRAASFKDARGLTAQITKNFYMDTVEVSQESFLSLMKVDPSVYKILNGPVNNISWYQAIQYCNARSKAFGLDTVYSFSTISNTSETGLVCNWSKHGFRLPSADEWELAAHSGQSYVYPTNNGTLSCSNVNYQPCGIGKPKTVGTFSATPFGLFDMAGNVGEWCWDIYPLNGLPDNRVDYHGATATMALRIYRIARGGSYKSSNLQHLQADYISSERADQGTNNTFGVMGFRCVLPE